MTIHHVDSIGGHDGGNGSRANPYRSPAAIESRYGSTVLAGDTVALKGGRKYGSESGEAVFVPTVGDLRFTTYGVKERAVIVHPRRHAFLLEDLADVKIDRLITDGELDAGPYAGVKVEGTVNTHTLFASEFRRAAGGFWDTGASGSGNKILGCRLVDLIGDAVSVAGSAWLCEGLHLLRIGRHPLSGVGAGDGFTAHGSGTFTARGCLLELVKRPSFSISTSGDNLIENCLIAGGNSWDPLGPFAMAPGEASTATLTLRNCLIHHGAGDVADAIILFSTDANAVTMVVEGCTVINDHNAVAGGFFLQLAGSTMNVDDNVFLNRGAGAGAGAFGTWVGDNNRWHPDGAAIFNGTTDLAGFKTATGSEANSTAGDPELELVGDSLNSAFYRPKAGSPLLAAGTGGLLSADFAGRLRDGTSPTVGALEYLSVLGGE